MHSLCVIMPLLCSSVVVSATENINIVILWWILTISFTDGINSHMTSVIVALQTKPYFCICHRYFVLCYHTPCLLLTFGLLLQDLHFFPSCCSVTLMFLLSVADIQQSLASQDNKMGAYTFFYLCFILLSCTVYRRAFVPLAQCNAGSFITG